MAPHPHRQSWRRRLSAAFATRTRTYGTRSLGWRLLAPAVFVLAGALFVTSMVSAGGTDLRAGRYDDLDGLANAEAHDLEALRAKSADLSSQVDSLSKDLGSTASDPEQKQVDALTSPAGLSPVHGPGLTITLNDAPDDRLSAAGNDVSDLLVHQQDIQAVANALWAGGAEAMTLQGQRVVATTGIKCVGNTVILHGVPYSPPYRVSAVGPVERMLGSVDSSPYIALYLEQVSKGLGWKVAAEPTLDLPGYDGSTQLDYARPAPLVPAATDLRK
ncbi:MAG: DUF881 domain-containing protein [Nocardioidaceae bacterium]